MADFDSGVKDFIVKECTVRVCFPIDWKDRADVSCKHCPYLSSNERMCQLNKQPVFYPNTNIGYWCPFFETENKNEHNEQKGD